MAGEKIQRFNAGFGALLEVILRSPVASQSVELGELTFATEGATPMKGALELAMLKVSERRFTLFTIGV